jgi:hypothetical protein
LKLTADPQLDDLPDGERRAFILSVDCPSCFGGKPGMPCMAMNGNYAPKTTAPHRPRLKAARDLYRLQQATRK